jgi:hypothetical protein
MTYATSTTNKSQDSMKLTFKSHLSSVGIAALKARIEGNYRVAFNYTGLEFNYTVVLEGTEGPFTRAVNTLFPAGREDIIIQRAHS